MSQNDQHATVRGLLALLAETSVHAGTGAQLGAVDLPIQRERHTGWPTVYGTGLKGVLREQAQAQGWSTSEVAAVFGPETSKPEQREADRHSGALAISDARLLLFPIRTVGPAFAWVTCPFALARFGRDAVQAGISGVPVVQEAPTEDRAVVSRDWAGARQGILLEEFSYEVTSSQGLADLGGWLADHVLPADNAYAYWKELARRAIVLVSDEEFRDFVMHGTEVVTRVRLAKDGSKRVETGALWTEENLPADSLLYSFVAAWQPASAADEAMASARAVMAKLESLVAGAPVVQIGGKETVGRGFVAVRLAGGNHAQA